MCCSLLGVVLFVTWRCCLLSWFAVVCCWSLLLVVCVCGWLFLVIVVYCWCCLAFLCGAVVEMFWLMFNSGVLVVVFVVVR